jgi:hypothetical protein
MLSTCGLALRSGKRGKFGIGFASHHFSSSSVNAQNLQNGDRKSQESKTDKNVHSSLSFWREQKRVVYEKMLSTVFRRQYSSSGGANPPPEKLPPLMNFPHIMWPKVTFAIRNWFLANFIIRPHMDKEFDIREFDKGARQVQMRQNYLN